MAVLSIRISGDPVLHQPAATVTDFGEELQKLITDMVDTMHEAPGVGLAAPQVGVSLRVFVYDWEDDDGNRVSGTAVNPQLWIEPIEPGAPDDESDAEGCLSFPGERFALRRSNRVILRAQSATGEPFELEASGWLARILQHEFDHLDGWLYVDRLEGETAKAAAKVLKRNGWGSPGHSWMPGVDDLEG